MVSQIDYHFIKKLDKAVDARFIYTSEEGDQWRSFATEFLADPNYVIRDDCDTKASTILDLLARQGVPQDRLYRVVVLSPSATADQYIDHKVAMVRLDSGSYYIIGDTFTEGVPKSIHATVHKIVQISRVDWGTVWADYTGEDSLLLSAQDVS